MPDYRSYYEKDYLGAWDIKSADMVLTITKCVQGALNRPGTNKKTKKPVVYFQETEKGLALNSTNGKTIAALYGNMVESWPSKQIALYKSTTRNPEGGDDVDCLRIRQKVPTSKAAAPESGKPVQAPSGGQPQEAQTAAAQESAGSLLYDQTRILSDDEIGAMVGKCVTAKDWPMALDFAGQMKDEARRLNAKERIVKAQQAAA